MLCDNSCVYCYVYYCAIKLRRFDASSRHFQLVKKHTQHANQGEKKAEDPPPTYLVSPLLEKITIELLSLDTACAI